MRQLGDEDLTRISLFESSCSALLRVRAEEMKAAMAWILQRTRRSAEVHSRKVMSDLIGCIPVKISVCLDMNGINMMMVADQVVLRTRVARHGLIARVRDSNWNLAGWDDAYYWSRPLRHTHVANHILAPSNIACRKRSCSDRMDGFDLQIIARSDKA